MSPAAARPCGRSFPRRRGHELWLEFEYEAARYGVDPHMCREDLAALIDASCVVMERAEHRATHSEASDFVRWGRRGGLETLRRYGRGWFVLLGRRRHGRITPEELRAGTIPALTPPPLSASPVALAADAA
jgi:hypothetical protein